ncbi:MAG: RNA pyrophosphohydrolase [Salaquimonas sp.]
MSKKEKKPKKHKGDLPYRACVGIMVLNDDGKVWVGHRLSPDHGELSKTDKRWQMPQGGIDKDEASLDAAKRELWEETGITNVELLAKTPDWITYDLPDDLMGVALKGKYRGQKMAWFAFRYMGDTSEFNISNPPDGAPVEFDAWDWVDMESLPELIVPFKRPVYVAVVDAFRHLK